MADEPRIEVVGSSGTVIGDHATVHQHFAAERATSWPVRVGRPPLLADAFQERPGAGGGALLEHPGTRVLTGGGGVGKTQLAARAWSEAGTDLTVWVSASSAPATVDGYATAAGVLGLADAAAPEVAAGVFLNWLAVTDRSWLVVLDDVADPADLRGLWPPPGGRVLVTTRRRDATLFGHGRERIDVDVFARGESVGYLARRLPAVGSGDDLHGLAADVADLPIALAQASAYVLDEKITVAGYRALLADRTAALADLMPADAGDEHERAVAATWSLAVRRADLLPPAGAAGRLAELVAVLDPNGIPEAVLTSAAARGYLGGGLTAAQARRALLNLDRLSVVGHDPAAAARTVRMHALAQRATREASADVGAAARAAGDALLEAWPEIERDTDLARSLRANAAALWPAAGDALWTSEGHPVLWRAASSLGHAGLVHAAVERWTALHDTSARVLGPDHRDTLAIRNDLAHWRGQTGDATSAVAAYEELVADYLRVRGPDDHATLTARGNLARWRGEAGDLAGAITALEELLADHRSALGDDHPNTLVVRNILAFRRGEAGDPAGAVAALEEVLADRRRVLGPDHPDTLTARNNLALWRGEAGDPAAAVTALEGLLADRRRVLGPDHPDTLAAGGNLAHWRGMAGDPTGAVAGFEALLADCLRVLGPDHLDTRGARAALAYWRDRPGPATRPV